MTWTCGLDVADYAALMANIKDCLDGAKASAAPLAKAVAKVVVVQCGAEAAVATK